MKIAAFTLPLAAAFLGHAAVAASAYTLSGTYAFMEFTQCAADFSTASTQVLVPPAGNPGTANVVGSVNPIQTGVLGIGVGYITFTPSDQTSGTAAGSQNSIVGGSLQINSSTFNMQSESSSFSDVPYSFNVSAGTFTFGGNTYTVAFGGISADGVVQTAYLVRQSVNQGNSNCLDAINATRQLAANRLQPLR